MFSGSTSERLQSQASLPPLESPYLINASSRSISYRKSTSPSDKFQLYKLQEEIKTLQDDIYRKDKLIEQMSKLELKTCSEKMLDPMFPCNKPISTQREEVAALSVKLDNLKIELREANNELQQKETMAESLKQTNGQLREEIARMQVAITNSSKEMDEFCDAKEAFETIRQRNDILISSLQTELVETQKHLMESRIYGKQLEDKLTEISLIKEEFNKQNQEFKNAVKNATSEEITSVSEIVDKVKTLLFEKETLTNKILSYEEKFKSRDCEQQASRQTITRLVSKLSSEEAKNSKYEESITALKRELDQYKMSKTIIESDINSFECQLASLNKEIEILNQDNEIKSRRISELTTNSKINQQSAEQQNQISQFLNSIVAILSGSYKTPTDDSISIYDWIIGCINSLLQNKDAIYMRDTDESVKSDLLEGSNLENVSGMESRLKSRIEDLERRLKNAEKELVNSSVVIDGLNCDKTKYFRILSELARVMNMNEINKDIGFDMISEALYGRALQLQKLEYDTKTDRRLAEHSLTRKVKELKEKVHSKDLHIDLLHKKLASIEGKQHNFEIIGKERDKELSSNKKLVKHNQKLQEEVDNLRTEIVDLKGSLLNNNKLQINVLTQDQEIKVLNAKLEKLETVRQKQSKLLNEFKSSQNGKDKDIEEIKSRSDIAIASLNSELQLVRDTLNDCRKKEQQMIEMRAVVSKLLGLDMDSLAIPDFEIINRLERLIAAHQSNIFTQFAMESTLRDMNQGLYQDPCVLHSHHSHIITEEPIYSKSNPNH